jgi:hypothetical protein
MDNETSLIPDDQQEDEDDIPGPVSFKDAVVMNADWTIETINSQIKKGNIDLQPGFQRRAAWDDTRKSRLLESIIVGMPVPNIVLAENRDHRGRFIVIDGKQRLVAISDFMAGKFNLRGLDIRGDLNNSGVLDLPSSDIEYLENATLRSTVIRNWNDESYLYKIFFRLNSGSLPLSPQELRRALIGGHLLEAIDAYLMASRPYKELFGSILDRRMRDSELVLRFLAFDRNLMGYAGDFRAFLDETTRFFEGDWKIRQSIAHEGFVRLDRSLELSLSVFGASTFKKWLGERSERVINRAIFDCIARFFADQVVSDAVRGQEVHIVEAFKKLCLEVAFRDSIERTTKSVQATFYRIDRWGQVLADCLGLTYDKISRRIA